MKCHRGQISVFLIILIVAGCYRPPEFPDIPYIEYQSMQFIKKPDSADVLNLTFEFEDGDGDIGLTGVDLFPPYHPFNYIIDSQDSLVMYGNEVVPPLYAVNAGKDNNLNRRLFSETDNRPPFNCSDYTITEENDTLYIQQNEYYYNLRLKFFKKTYGDYVEIDPGVIFGNSNCKAIQFDGRIPIFEPDNLGRSLSGEMTYAMISNGIETLFKHDTFKIDFFIYDRALNKSNVVSTPDLTLPDITK